MARKPYRSLAEYLRLSGDTQESLALRVGVSQAAISRYQRGESFPRPALALRLSRLTGVPVDLMMKAARKREAA